MEAKTEGRPEGEQVYQAEREERVRELVRGTRQPGPFTSGSELEGDPVAGASMARTGKGDGAGERMARH